MTRRKTTIGQMKECVRPGCETQIAATSNRLYCETCKKAVKTERAALYSSQANAVRRARVAKAKAVIMPESVLITDVEQKALNLAIDNKYAVPTLTKIYVPGTTEFRRVAREITHIGRVRRGCSADTTFIDAEPQGKNLLRRFEAVNDL